MSYTGSQVIHASSDLIIVSADIRDFDEAFYRAIFHLMQSEKQSRIMCYSLEAERKRSILGDWLIRQFVSERTAVTPSLVVFDCEENGKPYLAFPATPRIEFNVSHSGNRVVAAFDKERVGIDIEQIRKFDLAIMDHVLHPVEKEFVVGGKGFSHLDDAQGSSCFPGFVVRFFEVWCMKEAYLKCIGCGIKGAKKLKALNVFDLPVQFSSHIIATDNNYVTSCCISRHENFKEKS